MNIEHVAFNSGFLVHICSVRLGIHTIEDIRGTDMMTASVRLSRDVRPKAYADNHYFVHVLTHLHVCQLGREIDRPSTNGVGLLGIRLSFASSHNKRLSELVRFICSSSSSFVKYTEWQRVDIVASAIQSNLFSLID